MGRKAFFLMLWAMTASLQANTPEPSSHSAQRERSSSQTPELPNPRTPEPPTPPNPQTPKTKQPTPAQHKGPMNN
jgi:hypothetical protein